MGFSWVKRQMRGLLFSAILCCSSSEDPMLCWVYCHEIPITQSKHPCWGQWLECPMLMIAFPINDPIMNSLSQPLSSMRPLLVHLPILHTPLASKAPSGDGSSCSLLIMCFCLPRPKARAHGLPLQGAWRRRNVVSNS